MKKIIIFFFVLSNLISGCTSKYYVSSDGAGRDVTVVAPESEGDERIKKATAGVISILALAGLIAVISNNSEE